MEALQKAYEDENSELSPNHLIQKKEKVNI
jgi:hypothetical protein